MNRTTRQERNEVVQNMERLHRAAEAILPDYPSTTRMNPLDELVSHDGRLYQIERIVSVSYRIKDAQGE